MTIRLNKEGKGVDLLGLPIGTKGVRKANREKRHSGLYMRRGENEI